ncbi:MAG: InlB B-repeat-containing protein [Clostridia bacterium]|nr:InlB B-repeat-containing protein [Clostridia bacterium]
MKRLRKSVKILILILSAIVVAVGVTIGVIIATHNRGGKGSEPSPVEPTEDVIPIDQDKLDDLSNDINVSQSEYAATLTTYDNAPYVEYGRNVDSACSYKTITALESNYFVYLDSNDKKVFVTYKFENGTYTFKTLTNKVSSGGFVRDEAVDYEIDYTDHFVLVRSFLRTRVDDQLDSSIYDVVDIKDFTDIKVTYSFDDTDGYASLDPVKFSDNFLIYIQYRDLQLVGTTYTGVTDFHAINLNNSDEKFEVVDVSFVGEPKIYFSFFKNCFVFKNLNTQDMNVCYINNEKLIKFDIQSQKNENDQPISSFDVRALSQDKIFVTETINGGAKKYYVCDFSTEQANLLNYELTEGYSGAQVHSISSDASSYYVTETNDSGDSVKKYFSANNEFLFSYSGNYEILRISGKNFVTEEAIYEIQGQNKIEKVLEFSVENGTYLIQSDIVSDSFVIKREGSFEIVDITGKTIFRNAELDVQEEVNGEIETINLNLSMFKIYNVYGEYTTGYAKEEDEYYYFLINAKTGEYSFIDDYYQNDNVHYLNSNGACFYLTQDPTEKFAVYANGEKLFEGFDQFRFAEQWMMGTIFECYTSGEVSKVVLLKSVYSLIMINEGSSVNPFTILDIFSDYITPYDFYEKTNDTHNNVKLTVWDNYYHGGDMGTDVSERAYKIESLTDYYYVSSTNFEVEFQHTTSNDNHDIYLKYEMGTDGSTITRTSAQFIDRSGSKVNMTIYDQSLSVSSHKSSYYFKHKDFNKLYHFGWPNGKESVITYHNATKTGFPYEITYNLHGGTYGDNHPTKVNYDQTFTVNNPTKTGYTFTGWDITYGTNFYAIGTKETSFENIIKPDETTNKVNFDAQWKANTYSILYVMNSGGWKDAKDRDIEHATKGIYDTVFTVHNPYRPGYTFMGWDITGMDDVTHYYGGHTEDKYYPAFNTTGNTLTDVTTRLFMNLHSTEGATVTFTAKWNARTYTIYYYGNNDVSRYSAKYTKTINGVNVTCTRVSYTSDQTDRYEYTTTQTVTYNTNFTTYPSDLFTRKYHSFQGWSIARYENIADVKITDKTYWNAGREYTYKTQGITYLYAIWKQNTYKVEFGYETPIGGASIDSAVPTTQIKNTTNDGAGDQVFYEYVVKKNGVQCTASNSNVGKSFAEVPGFSGSSGVDFSVELNLASNNGWQTYYEIYKIELLHFAYGSGSSSSSGTDTTIELNKDSAKPTSDNGVEFIKMTSSSYNEYYQMKKSPVTSAYNYFRYDFTFDGGATISFGRVYYPHADDNYSEIAVETGEFGFQIKVYARAKQITGDKLKNTSLSSGSGTIDAYNVTPVYKVGKNDYYVFVNGKKYSLSLEGSNKPSGYYKLNASGTLTKSSETIVNGSTDGSTIYIGSGQGYAPSGNGDLVAYYLRVSPAPAGVKDSDYTLSSRNYANTQILKIRPEQKIISVSTNASDGLTSSNQYDLTSYLSSIVVTFNSTQQANRTLSFSRTTSTSGWGKPSMPPTDGKGGYSGTNNKIVLFDVSYQAYKTLEIYSDGQNFAIMYLVTDTSTNETFYILYINTLDASVRVESTFSHFNSTVQTTITNQDSRSDGKNYPNTATVSIMKSKDGTKDFSKDGTEDFSIANPLNFTVQPSNSVIMSIIPAKGFIVTGISVNVGGSSKMSIALDESTFSKLLVSNATDGYLTTYYNGSSYQISKKSTSTLVQQGRYVGESTRHGLFIQNSKTTSWTTGTIDSFDNIYFLISGMTSDVTITVTTKSYIEFGFVDSTSGTQLGYDSTKTTKAGKLTKLHMLVNTGSGWVRVGNGTVDASYLIVTDVQGDNSHKVFRLIFLGLKDYFKNGVKFYASGENYSAYFSGAKAYNNSSTYALKYPYDGINQSNFEGRKSNGEPLTLKSDGVNNINIGVSQNTTYNQDDQLTYVYLTDSDLFSVLNRGKETKHITNDDKEICKHILIMSVQQNQNVNLKTSSYLYNQKLTESYINSFDASALKKTYYGTNGQYGPDTYYSYYDGTAGIYGGSGLNLSFKKDDNYVRVYQLDYVSGNYSKKQSWFNDTVLSNIELSYTPYNSNKTNFNYQTLDKSGKTTVSTDNDNVKISGYGIKFIYREIPGYYLQFIDILIPEYSTFTIPIRTQGLNEYGDYNYSKLISIGTEHISFRVVHNQSNAEYEIYLYDTSGSATAGEKSIAILSGNIDVNFYSMAYSYKINYNKNYGNSSSYYTVSDIPSDTGYYDSMKELNGSTINGITATKPSMFGYTFIGWSSNPFDSNAELWNSQSKWTDVTSHFNYLNRNNLISGANLSAVEFYAPNQAGIMNFITDTGFHSTENYNFWAKHHSLFVKTMTNSSNHISIENALETTLYAVWKANTYLLTFDFNDANNGIGSSTAQIGRFDSGSYKFNLGYSGISAGNLGIYNGIQKLSTKYYFYVKFDSDDWFVTDSQTLTNAELNEFYAYHTNSVKATSLMVENKLDFIIDKYGYTWLGWMFKDEPNGSLLYSTTANTTSTGLITLTSEQLSKFSDVHEIGEIKFVYKDKNTYEFNYVYFYEYGTSGVNVSDYLNGDSGSKTYSGNFAYFDTSLAYDGYKTTTSKINGISRNSSNGSEVLYLGNSRYIVLHSSWKVNNYTVVIDWRDSNSTYDGNVVYNSTGHVGSTFVTNKSDIANQKVGTGLNYISMFTTDFDNALFISDLANKVPVRIGYRFVGWSFVYNSTTVNQVLNKFYNGDIFGTYEIFDSIVNDRALYTSSTILGYSDFSNKFNNLVEGYGDREGNNDHYIYIFALWEEEVFNANVVLNIDTLQLKNAYENDSKYNAGFYKLVSTGGVINVDYSSFETVIDSNYLKQNGSGNYTYADAIINVDFVFKFDDAIENAYCTINSTKYYLKDFFAISTGYYFTGLRTTSDDGSTTLISNTFNTSFAPYDSSKNNALVNKNNNGKVEIKKSTFDYNFYLTLNRSNAKLMNDSTIFETDNRNALSSINYTDSIFGGSTNVGYLTVGGKKIYIEIEKDPNSSNNDVAYIRYEGKKYRLEFSDNIIVQKPFLKFTDGNTLRTIQFNSEGKPFISTSTLSRAIELSFGITIKDYLSGLEENIPMALRSAVSTFVPQTTRQFTLYAGWEIKNDFVVSLVNGNNTLGEHTEYSNPGLAGFYQIDSLSSNNNTEVGITNSNVTFYDDISLGMTPYFNGRFLSLVTFVYHSIDDENNNVAEYTVSIKFKWNNETYRHEIEYITFKKNADDAGMVLYNFIRLSADDSYVVRFLTGSGTDSITNRLTDSLSVLDKNSFDISNGFFKVLRYLFASDGNYDGRIDVSKTTMNLTDLMSDIEVTCYYSIQTYHVVLDSLLNDDGELPEEYGVRDQYILPWSMEDLQAVADVTSVNYPQGSSYDSAVNYKLMITATISEDVNSTVSTTYNIPYGYYIYGSAEGITTGGQGNRPWDPMHIKPEYQSNLYRYAGYDQIYTYGYYTNGGSQVQIKGLEGDPYYAQGSAVLTQRSYYDLAIRLNLPFYTFNGWYELVGEVTKDGKTVTVARTFGYDDQRTYIGRNIHLYAYYYANNKPVSIQFYEWDDATNAYTKMDASNYTRNSDLTNTFFSPVGVDSILTPIEGNQRYADEQGRVILNEQITYGFDTIAFNNENYNPKNFNTGQTSASYQILSNKLLKIYWNYLYKYQTLKFTKNGESYYIQYDESTKEFFYVDDNGTHRGIVSKNIGSISTTYPYKFTETNSDEIPLEFDEIVRYDYPGAKMYLKMANSVLDKYYEFKRISWSEGRTTYTIDGETKVATEWLKTYYPRFAVTVGGITYFWLPHWQPTEHTTGVTTAEYIFTEEGNGLSTIGNQAIDFAVIYEMYAEVDDVYYPIIYPKMIKGDEGGSPYINPIKTRVNQNEYNSYAYVEINDDKFYYAYKEIPAERYLYRDYDSSGFINIAEFSHSVYSPVNDNFRMNITAATTKGTWESNATYLNILPNKNSGLHYPDQTYGLLGYIGVTNEDLDNMRSGENGDNKIYQAFKKAIDGTTLEQYETEILLEVNRFIEYDVSIKTLTSNILRPVAYKYTSTLANFAVVSTITVQIPLEIQFEISSGNYIPISATLEWEFNALSKNTIVAGDISAIPIFHRSQLEITDNSVGLKTNADSNVVEMTTLGKDSQGNLIVPEGITIIQIDTTKMLNQVFSDFNDFIQIYSKDLNFSDKDAVDAEPYKDLLRFVVLNEVQYSFLMSQMQTVSKADAMGETLRKYTELISSTIVENSDVNNNTISINVNQGKQYVFAYYSEKAEVNKIINTKIVQKLSDSYLILEGNSSSELSLISIGY